MANKVAVPQGENVQEEAQKKIKKKHGKCFTCCMITLVFTLVVLGTGFGVGWYIGDKYTRQYLGLSMGDTFGVLNGLYWTDDDDVVSTSFRASDREGLYKEIKRNVFLRDDAEVDFDDALITAINKYLGVEQEQKALRESNGGGGEDDEQSIMDILLDMVAGILDKDKIDIDRLSRYDENDDSTDEYRFNLKDKQLAAFLDMVLTNMLKHPDSISALQSVSDMIDLSGVLALKQVRFRAKTGYEEGSDERTVISATADVTVWLGLQKAANGAIKKVMRDAGYGWAGGFVGWLGDVLLPENVYITLHVPLDPNGTTEFTINDMTGERRKNAEKLINNICERAGIGKLTDMLDEYVDYIRPYLEKIPYKTLNNGAITADLLGILAENVSETLTKPDLIYVMQALLSGQDAQLAAIEPYLYKDRYLKDGREVYIKGGVAGQTPIDYERRFLDEIKTKYALELGEQDTLADVLKLFGVSLDGEESGSASDLKSMISQQKFSALINSTDSPEVIVTDRMLAAALGSQLDSVLGGVDGLGDMNITLDALSFVPGKTPGRLYALLAVNADITSVLGSLDGDSMVGTLVDKLLPKTLLLTVKVDVTRSLAAGAEYDEPELVLNSCKNTDRALAAIGALMPDADLEGKIKSMTDKVEELARNLINELYQKLNITPVSSTLQFDQAVGWTGANATLPLPDVFTLVTDLLLKRENGERVVQPQTLHSVLRELNNEPSVTNNIAQDYSGFLSQVTSKFYLDTQINDFDALLDFMSDFDTTAFLVEEPDPAQLDVNKKYMAYDTRPVRDDTLAQEDLVPRMSAAELGKLLADKMDESGEDISDYELVRLTTSAEDGAQKMHVTLKIALTEVIPSDVRFLISAQNMYVTATVDLADVVVGTGGAKTRYAVTMTINDMDEDTYGALLDIINFLSDDSFDIQPQIDGFGEVLYEQLSGINAGSAEWVDPNAPQPVTEPNDGDDFFKITNDGLEIVDFYTFLANKLGQDVAPATLKTVLQGMFPRVATAGFVNTNNYLVSEIVTNPPPTLPQEATHVWDSQAAPTDKDTFKIMTGTPYSDVMFNGMLKTLIEDISETHEVEVMQNMILASGDTGAAATAARAWINARIDQTTPLTSAGNYLAITFKMKAGGIGEANDRTKNIYPDQVYITVVYQKLRTNEGGTEKDSFSQLGIIFNSLDYESYTVLIGLMSLDEEDAEDESKINIKTVSKKGEDALNSITKNEINIDLHVNFFAAASAPAGCVGYTTAPGIGCVTLTT